MGDCSKSVGLYGNRTVLNSETLDRSVSYRSAKVDAHATARMLFDNIARDPEDKVDEFEVSEAKNEGFEECEDLLLCGSGGEGDTVFESSSPVEKFGVDVDDDDDETSAWIECNQSCSSWIDDVYEKPYMVGAGLDNLGNTCFFNAVMQCFTHTVLLVHGLYAYMHPTPCDCSNERFCLLCALREHMELSLSSNGKSVAPWKFVDNLSYFSSSFLRYQQEDAHEFLQCFLDRLESCLTNLKTKDDALPPQSFNLVKQVFGGRVISKLRCCNCNHVSDTYEPSVDLSLEIEDVNSLPTALESFTKVEHIEDEEMKFTCDHCKQKVSVEKQLMLDQIPPVCAFHLKRFKNDGSYVEKIDKHVEFPLELDLELYTSGSQNNNMDFMYELYAVVVHAGFSSSSGHYYSYVRSAPDTWYKFDDRKVTYASEACVLSEEAYILFYAKQGTPWFSNFLETFKPSLNSSLSNTSPKSVLENVEPPNIHPFDINATKNDLPQSDEVAPAPLTPVGNPRKENIPLTLKEYSSNHRIKVETNIPTSAPKTELDTPDQVPSPSTPPVSPELYFSDDDDVSGVVFASKPKPKPSKLAKKATCKRLRDNEVDDSAKREALKICRKMPGSRGTLLISAMSSDGSRKNHSKSCDRF